MAQVEITMPKMGESIVEATILKWMKKEGERIEMDEPIVEIATDKVDSEVPSTEAGVIVKLLYKEGDVVQIGKPFVLIEMDSGSASEPVKKEKVAVETYATASTTTVSRPAYNKPEAETRKPEPIHSNGEGRF